MLRVNTMKLSTSASFRSLSAYSVPIALEINSLIDTLQIWGLKFSAAKFPRWSSLSCWRGPVIYSLKGFCASETLTVELFKVAEAKEMLLYISCLFTCKCIYLPRKCDSFLYFLL